jgi:hypothetical protein
VYAPLPPSSSPESGFAPPLVAQARSCLSTTVAFDYHCHFGAVIFVVQNVQFQECAQCVVQDQKEGLDIPS